MSHAPTIKNAPDKKALTLMPDDFTQRTSSSHEGISTMDASKDTGILPEITRLQTLFLLQVDQCETIADVICEIRTTPYRESISVQTIYQIASRLTNSGMIRKERTGRKTNVSLTGKGRKQIESAVSFCRFVLAQ